MPLTRMQREYLANCTHRYNVKCGATGSGKSYVDIAVTIPQRLLAMRGEGLAVMIGNTRSTLERNILEPMRSLYSEDVVSQIGRDNTAQIFGRKVYCLGADKKTSVSKIQGATFEWVYGDEVATWSEDVFQMLKSRLRCEHSHFDGTCNPDSPNHWFKRFLDGDSDIYRQDYTIWDGALAPDVIEALIKDYGSGVYYDRYILPSRADIRAAPPSTRCLATTERRTLSRRCCGRLTARCGTWWTSTATRAATRDTRRRTPTT